MWVANLKSIKQPEIFIRIAKELHPVTGAEFIMVGKMQGSTIWCDRIKKNIKNTKGLDYLGGVSQEKVNDLLNQSSLLVNTSKVEGFSNTFIQAWMRKVPVISLHVDPDSLLQTKQIGRLSGKYEQLKQDVKELIENNELRKTIGENAYQYSTEHHSFENIKKIVNLMGN
jgi:glycosyltransferase involved in cell wall biosynthesis